MASISLARFSRNTQRAREPHRLLTKTKYHHTQWLTLPHTFARSISARSPRTFQRAMPSMLRHAATRTWLALATIGLAEFRETLSISTTTKLMVQTQGTAPLSRRQETKVSYQTPPSHCRSLHQPTSQRHAQVNTARSASCHLLTTKSRVPTASTTFETCLVWHASHTPGLALWAKTNSPAWACTSATLPHDLVSYKISQQLSSGISLGCYR